MRLNFGILKRPNSPIPGFGLTMGYTVFYLSIIVIIPLIALFTEAFSMGFDAFIPDYAIGKFQSKQTYYKI